MGDGVMRGFLGPVSGIVEGMEVGGRAGEEEEVVRGDGMEWRNEGKEKKRKEK